MKKIDIMEIFRRSLIVFWVFLAQIGFSQNAVDWELQSEKLNENVELWESLNILNYSFIMDKGCLMCGWYFPAKIVVRNGQVIEVLNPETEEPMLSRARGEEGELVFPKRQAMFENINEIFSIIKMAIENNVTTIHPGMKASYLVVEYDEAYGFPIFLSVGYYGGISRDGSKFNMTDGSSSFRITEFVNAL